MQVAAAAITSTIISETISQAVSATFSQGLEHFHVYESKKKLLILLTNDTEDNWSNAEVYLADGTSNDVPPRTIKKKEGKTYMIRRSRLPIIAGGGAINGILTYKINDNSDVLVIYFSIPVNNVFFQSNRWIVKLYRNELIQSYGTGRQKLEKIYNDIKEYKKNADNSYNYESLGNGYEAKCIMTSTAKSKYRVDVKKIIPTEDKVPSSDKLHHIKSDQDEVTGNEDPIPIGESFTSCKELHYD